LSGHKHSLLRRCTFICLFVFSLLQTQVNAANIEAFTPKTDSFNFTLTDLKDKSHSLNYYRGKVVLINFWASWCPPCIHEMPALKKLKQDFTNKPFEILTLNVGEKKYKVRKFAKMLKLDLPVLLDTSSKTFDAWGVKTLPTSFLIDATGRVRYRIFGNPGWHNEEAMNIINKLLSETLKTTESSQ
jgi:thiol-disulfide isomerase/thioredoxin